MEAIAPSITESHDLNYIELIETEIVPYNPNTNNQYGTKWLLFKTLKTGTTEIVFNAPFEYWKIFKITITPA